MLTQFYPATHGFHFSNRDINWSYGPLSGRMLCGGMTFASLDYYYAEIEIPADTSAPAEGTPLQRYIYGRQMHAHRYAVPLLAQGRSRWGPNELDTSVRERGAFHDLKRIIDSRRPVPVLLGASNNPASTNSHWVLAIGYESSHGRCSRLYLYDNNHPNRTCRLDVDADRNRLVHSVGGRFGFFVPYPEYRAWPPNQPIGDVSLGEAGSNPLGLGFGEGDI